MATIPLQNAAADLLARPAGNGETVENWLSDKFPLCVNYLLEKYENAINDALYVLGERFNRDDWKRARISHDNFNSIITQIRSAEPKNEDDRRIRDGLSHLFDDYQQAAAIGWEIREQVLPQLQAMRDANHSARPCEGDIIDIANQCGAMSLLLLKGKVPESLLPEHPIEVYQQFDADLKHLREAARENDPMLKIPRRKAAMLHGDANNELPETIRKRLGLSTNESPPEPSL